MRCKKNLQRKAPGFHRANPQTTNHYPASWWITPLKIMCQRAGQCLRSQASDEWDAFWMWMQRVRALLTVILFTPVISAMLGILLTLVSWRIEFLSAIGLFPLFYFYSMSAMVLFGLPGIMLLYKFKFIKLWPMLGGGLIIGVLVAVIIRLPSSAQLSDVVSMGFIGMVSSLGCWLILRQCFLLKFWRRPGGRYVQSDPIKKPGAAEHQITALIKRLLI